MIFDLVQSLDRESAQDQPTWVTLWFRRGGGGAPLRRTGYSSRNVSWFGQKALTCPGRSNYLSQNFPASISMMLFSKCRVYRRAVVRGVVVCCAVTCCSGVIGCVDTSPDPGSESDLGDAGQGPQRVAADCADYPRDDDPEPIDLNLDNPAADALENPADEGPYVWEQVTIKGGGFVTGIVFSQAAPNLIYARTDVGGAYRFDIDAKRWLPLTDWLSAWESNQMGIESIATDPSDPARVYLAAGTYVTAGDGFILRSSDFGHSFERFAIGVPMGANANGRSMGERLMVDPNQPEKLYFASRNHGLRVSFDAGENWQAVDGLVDDADEPILGAEDYGLTLVVFDERDAESGEETQTIYVGAARLAEDDVVVDGASEADAERLLGRNPTHALFRSRDAGASWQPVPGQPETMMPHHAVLASDGMLYVAYNDRPGPNDLRNGAIWRFDTETESWTDVSPRSFSQRGGFGGLAVDAQNPSNLLATTLALWPDQIFRSDSSGACWARVDGNAKHAQNGADWLYFGGNDLSRTGWMGDVEIDPFNPSRALYITGQGVWWSDDVTRADVDTATNWLFQNDGLEETVALDLISPSEGAHLVSALGDIAGFRHDNFAESPPGGMFSNPVFGNTSSLDFAESDPDLMVRVGTNDGPHGAFSTDGGASWQRLINEPVDPEGQAQHIDGRLQAVLSKDCQ